MSRLGAYVSNQQNDGLIAPAALLAKHALTLQHMTLQPGRETYTVCVCECVCVCVCVCVCGLV